MAWSSEGLDRRHREPRGLGWLAWVVCAAAEGMAVACVVLLLAGHVSLSDAVDAYLVTNLGMVVTFATIAGLVAGTRPQNPIGWLFLGHSACFAVLTWLVWAVPLFAVLNSQRWITGDGPILFLFTVPLLPAAAAVAILRHDLYDIRVIVNRTRSMRC